MNQQLLREAARLGLGGRIDPENDDPEYLQRWRETLARFDELVRRDDAARARETFVYSGAPVREFRSAGDLEKLRTELHEYYEWPEAKAPEAAKAAKASEKAKAAKAFLVDAAYEYHAEIGLCVVLYTSRGERLLCPYSDYFYVQLSKVTPADLLEAMRRRLSFFTQKVYGRPCDRAGCSDARCVCRMIKNARMIRETSVVEMKSMYGYEPEPQRFLKIVTAYPAVTRHLCSGLTAKFRDLQAFEAHIDVVNKFMTQHRLSAGCELATEHLKSLGAGERLWTGGPLAKDGGIYEPHVMYFDIECLSMDVNTFPTADCCPVIQISYHCGASEGVLCLRETPGYESFETEAQMLIRFAQLVHETDPDFLCGFNSNRFDMPYLIDRMKVLGVHEVAGALSRKRHHVVSYRRTVKHSKQFGAKEIVSFDIPGRVLLDQFEIIRSNPMIRLRSYSLKAVCEAFLTPEDNKEDLKYKEIPGLFATPEGRARIASYCLQDTRLLVKLDRALMIAMDVVAQASVLGVTPDVCINRGLVYKIMCKLKQYTERHGFLIPSFTEDQKPASPAFQGATVLNCDAGYYKDPVCVLDFGSLYPSLIRSYNLDYTTIVKRPELVARYPERFELINGVHYAKAGVHRGLLPRLEADLAEQRAAAKHKMKLAPEGSVERAVWNAIQGGVKVCMNSVYGLTGSPTATVPCVEIASTITFLGRQNLMLSKAFVEAEYQAICAEPEPARVIYGDTDSIFILMPGVDVGRAIRYGKLLEAQIRDKVFGHLECLVMEYEKVYAPYIQVTPKRYAGLMFKTDAARGEVSASGLQLVKRDSALLCKRVMTEFFEMLLVRGDEVAALEALRKSIGALFADELPLEDFELSKKISKKPEEYKVQPPHIKAWLRMVRRIGSSEAPCVGERFSYVIRDFGKNEAMADCIVDTALVREKGGLQNMPIAKLHYFQLYIYNPMHVIVELIYGRAKTQSVLDPSSYERVEKVVQKPGNLLAFLGRTELVTKKRARANG